MFQLPPIDAVAGNKHVSRILDFLYLQYPKPSEIMMPELVENLDDENEVNNFISAIDYLKNNSYITFQDDMFGGQMYSNVMLTEKAISSLKD